jgi:thiol-disulfide isomerase/thioredoxin
MNFPGDYRGHLVLVSFWATWCAPCRAEEPYVVQAYEKFHGRGLEIIGVTLDAFQRTPAARVVEFVKEQHMPWPQVYAEGPAIAASYGVSAIPAAFLVDGDTGKILASGDDLRGEALSRTVEKHLKTSTRL